MSPRKRSGSGSGGLARVLGLLLTFGLGGLLGYALGYHAGGQAHAPRPASEPAPSSPTPRSEQAPAPPPAARPAPAPGSGPQGSLGAELGASQATAAPPRAAVPVDLTRPHAATLASLPRVALVIDDCGNNLDLLEEADAIPVPLTMAVMPRLAHSRESANNAFRAGKGVILHQPMEPESTDENPGEGAIRAGMSRREILRTLSANLDTVPHAAGFNNHMGSRATADAALMDDLFHDVRSLTLKHPGLFFLDSRTTPKTVAADRARKAGLRVAERNTFLDDVEEPAAIREQLAGLVATARQAGVAVGIGHLKPVTLAVLKDELPRLAGREVQFVLLADVVR